MKNLPKTETEASRKQARSGERIGESAGFAVVLFMRAAGSHKAGQDLFALPSALRAHEESQRRDGAVCRRENVQVLRVQMSVSDALSCGPWVPASRGFRRARDNRSWRLRIRPDAEPDHNFPPVEIACPDRASDAAGLRRMRRNALDAGLGARTLAAEAAEHGCILREKRLTVERSAA